MEALPELWAMALGGNQTFSRTGLIPPRTRPRKAGVENNPKTWDLEQWEATAMQLDDGIDTHMPTSYLSLASIYLRNIHQLGMQAGQSLNRAVRDKLFNAYVSGNTVTNASAVITATTISVVNLDGFTRKLAKTGASAGRPTPVSASNPIDISIPAIAYTGQITGFTADISGDEIHSGTLTITPGLTAGIPARTAVLTANRARLVYSNGAVRIDDITSVDQYRLADVRASVAQLRFDNVPPHEDGTYHCHLDPISESQIFGDNEWQRLNQSLPDYIYYRRMAIVTILGCTFYRNSEAPTTATVSEDPESGATTGFELVNPNGVTIHRPITTGQGAIEEKYIDESRYISDAGVMGKIGEFSVTNGGVQVMTERIRLILRAPQDRLQQVTSTSWSWSGDWPIPTDETAKSSPATYKRAVVVVHGS